MSFTHRSAILHGFYSSEGKKSFLRKSKEEINCSIRINKSQFPCIWCQLHPQHFPLRDTVLEAFMTLTTHAALPLAFLRPRQLFITSWNFHRKPGGFMLELPSCQDWLAHAHMHDDQSRGSPLQSTAVDHIQSSSEDYIPHILMLTSPSRTPLCVEGSNLIVSAVEEQALGQRMKAHWRYHCLSPSSSHTLYTQSLHPREYVKHGPKIFA